MSLIGFIVFILVVMNLVIVDVVYLVDIWFDGVILLFVGVIKVVGWSFIDWVDNILVIWKWLCDFMV